ncbi:clathrin interactor EPSIN 2-like [Phoenix dactylifera]|uniref:Clathrin interactor EPSIN 2-like n=1 Tax=Phoenix dactylifera TaxID=42345 RepID=A0A8B8JBL4_PHODC|nr:clathrin interactor EPSIN 2-like [Phoenix dactylifera]XP_038971220.1 clathrin interactor EPSIN 2-like [Phoenix dactylifera]
MKKAFDQTVRDLKREVNKKVLKIPGIEQKILDATSNEPWGPHGSHLADIAQATRNYQEYQMIMHVIWKRINDTGKNWRHVYKALIVLEYLVANGSERVIDEIREHAYQISTLSDFQYIDSSGRDQGSNVRRKSQSLVALVNDKERIQEVRQKALANRDKYRSTFSTGGTYRPSSYSSTGGYGDRYDDDRYGSRDEDRNGYGREREWGYRDDDRYGRTGDPYSREGDRYGRDFDDHYGRESYRDDDYRGSRSNDDYQYGSRNRSFDRDRDRSFDDDDRYSSRSGGGRADDPSRDERRFEHKLPEQNVGAAPSYEEVTKDTQPHLQEEKNGGIVAATGPKASPPSAPKASSPRESTSLSPDNAVPGVLASAKPKDIDGFDEFDPRGSVSAAPPTAPPAASGLEMDLFGSLSASDPINSLALVSVTSTAPPPEADVSANLGFGTNFVALSSTSTVPSQPSENPFGEPPFKATQESFPAQQQNFAPVTSVQLPSSSTGRAEPSLPVAPRMETAASFDFGDTFGGVTCNPSVPNGPQPLFANPANLGPVVSGALAGSNVPGMLPPEAGIAAFVPSQVTQPAAPANIQTTHSNLLPQSGPPAPVAAQAAQPTATNIQAGPHMNLLSQSGILGSPYPLGAASTSALPPARTQPLKEKFETKSTVWADTLNRGLVNLNISGPKINPHADIGIDFDSINRKEKLKEEKKSSAAVTSTVTMGKAMGAGSGIGRAGMSGLAPPLNPMMGSARGMGGGVGAGMGMGIGGYGGGMNQSMSMGMGMNMGMGMGVGMPMRPPTGMVPSGPGMPGVGYNPMMGMGSYGSQQPYGGGYR